MAHSFPTRRSSDLHANEKFALATQTMLEIRDIARQIDDAYTNPHIEAPTVAHSRRATDMIFQG